MKTLKELSKSEKVMLLQATGKRKHHFTKRTLIATSRQDMFLSLMISVNNIDKDVDVDILFIGEAEKAEKEFNSLADTILNNRNHGN